MTTRLGVQLFTFREYTGHDLDGVLARIAAMGYEGVETAGLCGKTATEFRELLDRHGLALAGCHVALPDAADFRDDCARAIELGADTVITGLLPETFASAEALRRGVDGYRAAEEIARAHGLRLGYHNHWWEFEPIAGGRSGFEVLWEMLPPSIIAEIDVYWVRTGGADPAHIVRALGDRAALLHLKDGPCREGEPMTALGDGIIDVPAVVAAGQRASWHIVELDACATDVFEAVERSFSYLRSGAAG